MACHMWGKLGCWVSFLLNSPHRRAFPSLFFFNAHDDPPFDFDFLSEYPTPVQPLLLPGQFDPSIPSVCLHSIQVFLPSLSVYPKQTTS